MGLDTSHNAWHGAYGAFNRWRNKLAEVAGYAVWEVTYDSGFKSPTAMIDWGHVTEDNLHGEWAQTPADPLLVLIAHSDCDGYIYPTQAGPLADRLEGLLPLLPNEEAPGHVRHWRQATQQFIDGLREAVAADEPLEFH